MMKLIRTYILILFAVFAVANSASSQSAEPAAQADSVLVSTVKVKGITCDMDLKMISANVEKLEGVSTCESIKKGPTTTFEVKYNPTLVTDKAIYAAIEGTGSCEDPDERPYKVKK